MKFNESNICKYYFCFDLLNLLILNEGCYSHGYSLVRYAN